ncbi:Ser-Thr-rich GPI-anchored membrane family protein [Thermodesulfobacteriota bacterium]
MLWKVKKSGEQRVKRSSPPNKNWELEKEYKMEIKGILAAFLGIALFVFFSTSNLSATTAIKPRSMPQPITNSIKLLSPNGGEKIRIGALHNIKWRVKGVSDNITIYITYKDRTLGTIARGVRASAGFYRWKVGQVLKTRIKTADGYKIVLKTGDRKVFDQSDRYFSIISGRTKSTSPLVTPKTEVKKSTQRPAPATARPISSGIKILSPNGGELITTGSEYQIRWSAKDVRDDVTIYLTDKNKTIGTIARNIKPTSGSYRWKVDNTLRGKTLKGDQYKIVLKTRDRKTVDESDRYFSITSHESGQEDTGGTAEQSEQQTEDTPSGSTPQAPPYINVAEPIQHIGWCPDTQYDITWDSNLLSSSNLKIELLRKDQTGFYVWRNITSNTPNDGTYQFSGLNDSQTPVLSIGIYVKVATLDDAVSGISPLVTLGKQLKLMISETDTWIWRKGSEYTIKWEQVCDLPAPLNIELLDSNHQHALTIASALTPLATAFTNVKVKQYKWTVPSNLTPGAYYIRLSSGTITKEKPIDIDEPFTTPSSPDITITSPNQSEGWCSDTDHTIQWTSNLPPNTNLKIDFVQSTSGGGFAVWRNITSSTPNDGSYNFTSPYTGAIAVRTKVSTLDNATVTIGDAFVYGAPLSLIQPNGLYTWRKGSNHSILWKQVCNLPGPVTIDLLDSNHQHVVTIASGLTAQAKTDLLKQHGYVWNIPMSLTPGAYYIRVSSGTLSKERSFNIDEPLN